MVYNISRRARREERVRYKQMDKVNMPFTVTVREPYYKLALFDIWLYYPDTGFVNMPDVSLHIN